MYVFMYVYMISYQIQETSCKWQHPGLPAWWFHPQKQTKLRGASQKGQAACNWGHSWFSWQGNRLHRLQGPERRWNAESEEPRRSRKTWPETWRSLRSPCPTINSDLSKGFFSIMEENVKKKVKLNILSHKRLAMPENSGEWCLSEMWQAIVFVLWGELWKEVMEKKRKGRDGKAGLPSYGDGDGDAGRRMKKRRG